MRKPSAIQPSGLTFCSHSCSAAYTNTHRINPMSIRRLARQKKQPICKNPLCNNQIKLENFQFCSVACRVESAKENNEVTVIQKIQAFSHAFERIPLKHEISGLYAKARIGYSTWNKAIIAAGYDPNPVRFSHQCIAKDGHRCDSQAERIVDDWLYRRGIKHNVHVPYPWKNGMKCDFLIGDIWIEIFGLAGELARYDQLKKEKLKLVKKYKLKLVNLSLKDVYSVNKLSVKLEGFFYHSITPRLI